MMLFTLFLCPSGNKNYVCFYNDKCYIYLHIIKIGIDIERFLVKNKKYQKYVRKYNIKIVINITYFGKGVGKWIQYF